MRIELLRLIDDRIRDEDERQKDDYGQAQDREDCREAVLLCEFPDPSEHRAKQYREDERHGNHPEEWHEYEECQDEDDYEYYG